MDSLVNKSKSTTNKDYGSLYEEGLEPNQSQYDDEDEKTPYYQEDDEENNSENDDDDEVEKNDTDIVNISDDDDDNDDDDDDNDDSKKKNTNSSNNTITPSEIIQKFMEKDGENIDFDNEQDDVYTDEDTSDDEYIKFDKQIRTDQILNHHNSLLQSNFDEISALVKVVRNKDGLVIDPLHKTLPILSKFERARILGLRAKQLANGATPFIKLNDNVVQNHIIAEMELEQNVLPFIVCRPLPNGKKEYWKIQDLEQIDY